MNVTSQVPSTLVDLNDFDRVIGSQSVYCLLFKIQFPQSLENLFSFVKLFNDCNLTIENYCELNDWMNRFC